VRPDPWDLLEKITAPTVLIAGTQEDPDRTQNEMAARTPDARRVYLTGVGHVGAFLRPDFPRGSAAPSAILRQCSICSPDRARAHAAFGVDVYRPDNRRRVTRRRRITPCVAGLCRS